jgi:maleylacetate reductase
VTTVAGDALNALVHDAPVPRVVFGDGCLSGLADEVARLGLSRVLVVTTEGRRPLGELVASVLGAAAAGVYTGARSHVPVDVAAAGAKVAREVAADGCVAVGGGSAIGLVKAISLDTGLPSVCVPTTYSGSEMTPVWGLTENGAKRTGRDFAVLPRTVLYDPDLTLDLPARTSAESGMNALAHAVEALYAPDVTPIVALMAEESIRLLATSLPAVVADPHDHIARALALRGAWLAGSCLGATTMSLHHKICHVLGGMFDLPHAAAHAVVLPSVAEFNLPAAPSAAAALRRALDTDDPLVALRRLGRELGTPASLAALGLSENALVLVAEAVITAGCANPRPVTGRDVLDILHSAWQSRDR